ncbi:PT domain-containing protein [Herpetosiphon gulosus]|uniref:PT repeat-containing protein n=1 Tax=Herpetosiphon gulosus TaxID=1973496 RepID=A0ABP9WUU1_9CHLR
MTPTLRRWTTRVVLLATILVAGGPSASFANVSKGVESASVETVVEPTAEPTTEPTAEPTVEPTAEPTVAPTAAPTATTAPTAAPVCNPQVDLSGWFSSNTVGKIWNKSSTCSYDVGMASYQKFDEIIDHQLIYSWAIGRVGPNTTVSLSVAVPECAAQIDVFYGSVLHSLDGQRYNERLLSARHIGGTNYCGVTTPTNTPEPTAEPTVAPTNTPEPTAEPTVAPTNTPEPTAEPTVAPTSTPEPTAEPTVAPTNTPEPTAYPTPTAVPTATKTPMPTATKTPAPTATSTPAPTATKTPVPTATKTPVPTATSTPTGKDCTYTQGYWKNHPNAWPVTSLSIGGVVYTQSQLMAIFNTSPRGDATYILAHQLIAAKLNVAQGANGSTVNATIAAADAWLQQHPLGSKPSGSASNTGTSYATQLDNFNNGLIGPGHCG